MTRFRNGMVGRTLFLFLVVAAGATRQARSAEPAREFLQGLRERGYYDMAVLYLEKMQDSKLAPSELRETLWYEMGTTLIEASRTQRDITLRVQQLDDAKEALDRFISQHPEHPLRAAAENQLGNVIVERARINVERAKQSSGDSARLLAEASDLYDEAYKVFARSQNDLRERLEQMKVIDPDDRRKTELRDQLRQDYLQVLLLAAAVKEESADTHEEGSPKYQELLSEAAAEYEEIYKKYRTRLAGLYARLYQGRCNQKLGKIKDALSYYADLLEQDDEPDAFRTLKTKTLQLAADCWLESKPPLYAEAVKRLEPWLADRNVRPNEERTETWLELRMKLARAQWELGRQRKQDKPNDPEGKRLQNDAKKNVLAVSRVPGPLQKEARELLAEWGAGGAGEDPEVPEPQTFIAAKQAGRDALAQWQTESDLLRPLETRLASETDPQAKQALEQQLTQTREQAESSRQNALNYFRKALALTGDTTDLRDVNIVRYFLCFLYYTSEEYYDAAVVGEFVARRYPESPGARQCAKIAMASYLKLYAADTSEDKPFASAQIIEIATFIKDKWPEQPEAIDALNTLIPFMIKRGDLDRAEQFLGEIPEDSPKRGEAEIKTGQAMWGEYLTSMQQVRKWENEEEPPPPGIDLAARRTELEELKSRAQGVLQAGVERVRALGKVDQSAATAALSLAQLYVDANQPADAIALLEDPELGPYTLVQKKSPVTQREGFDEETYKTALRAYISSLSGASDPQAVVAKAERVMDQMKDTVDQQTQIQIYTSLARDLEQQMAIADPAAKEALSQGFQKFLGRLSETSSDLGVLGWVGGTFASLARSYDVGGQLTDQAKSYYEQALSAYQKILDVKAYGDDPKRKIGVQLAVARIQQRLGQFPAARDIYREILADNRTMLNVQVDAAEMYQQWASYPGKEALYEKAMGGAEPEPDGKRENIIWGWGKLSQITARFPEYRNVFHQARYNLDLCRFKRWPDDKSRLKQAKNSILALQKLFGNDEHWKNWRPKQDALLKQIQSALGESPVGLPEDSQVARAE